MNDTVCFICSATRFSLDEQPKRYRQHFFFGIESTAFDSAMHDPKVLVANLKAPFSECVRMQRRLLFIRLPDSAHKFTRRGGAGKRNTDKAEGHTACQWPQ